MSQIRPSSLRQALRSATQAEHKRLETQPLMQRLLSPELSLAEYGQILLAQRAYYRLLEPALWPFEYQLRNCLPAAGYRYHSRLPFLERDCRQLALGEEDVLNERSRVFSPGSVEEGLGVLYVLEGASQGSRTIAHHLRRGLSLDSDNGASFYSDGAGQASWVRLRHGLEALPEDGPWVEALTGAKATFTALRNHFDHWQRQMSGRSNFPTRSR